MIINYSITVNTTVIETADTIALATTVVINTTTTTTVNIIISIMDLFLQ